MKLNIKKMTYEDRFIRKYYCKTSARGYIKKIKKKNRKVYRRKLKKELEKDLTNLD